MALPDSRNTTYAPGVQVKSADLNDLQDAIINAAHGDILMQLPVTRPPDGHELSVVGHFVTPTADGNRIAIDVPLKDNDVLKAVYAIFRNPDSKQARVDVRKRTYTGATDDGAGGVTSLGTFPQFATASNTFLQLIGASGINYTANFATSLVSLPERVFVEIRLEDVTNEFWEAYCVINRPI